MGNEGTGGQEKTGDRESQSQKEESKEEKIETVAEKTRKERHSE